MRARLGDRATLGVVAWLATWGNLAVQLVVWEGLYLLYTARNWNLQGLNYQLSVWPVIVDIIILMATMVLTYRQIASSERQERTLDAIYVLARGMDALLRQGEARDRQIADLMASVAQAHGEPVDAPTENEGTEAIVREGDSA